MLILRLLEFLSWTKGKSKHIKVRQSRNDFFQADVSSKKRTNEFDFTTMKPQIDLFVFLKKLKTPKRHLKLADL